MTDDPRESLPASVQLLWGLRETGRRGPKPSRTRDEIVGAAIELADAEGLAAVSMARVAAAVGASTMALYRYVANKDELLLLMSDAAIGTPPPLPPAGPWRPGLERWARAVRAVWMARPWLLQIPVTGPPAGPNNLLWLDAGLRALARTDLPGPERIGIVMAVSTYLRGEAWLSLDLTAASTSDPESYGLDYGGAFAQLLDPAQYPELTAVVTDESFREPPDPDHDDFEYGLGILLDGVARRIDG